MSTAQTEPRTAARERWVVDTDESVVEFAARGFWGLATTRGRFDRFDGSYEVGPDGPKIELTIDADSLDTGNRMRDKHLRSGDFFHIGEHPQIRFTSTHVRDVADGVLRIQGDLDVAGTVAPLDFAATVERTDDGFVLETTNMVDQQRFGMSSGRMGMVRRPTTLHVKAYLTGSER